MAIKLPASSVSSANFTLMLPDDIVLLVVASLLKHFVD
jgi:hypothetical protein